MKICPECEKPLPQEVIYCVYCGTKADLPQQIKSERKIFFLTPLFIFFICLAFTYDLSCESYVETAITMTGVISLLYFLGAAFLGILKFFFNIATIPSSYFTAGITAIINFITVVFLTKITENIFLLKNIESMGPSSILKNHILLMAIILFPIQFIETLAITANSKTITKPESVKNSIQKLFFSKTYILIPLLLISICSIGINAMPKQSQYSLLCESLIVLSAHEKASNYLEQSLKNYPDDAQLSNLKSVYLTDFSLYKNNNLTATDTEKEALEYAKTAVKQKPNSPVYRHQLCRTLELNQQYSEAIENASIAANLAKEDQYLWQYLGDLNQKLLKYPEAIDAYNKVLSLNPENPIVLNNMAYALLANNTNIDTAIELAKKAVEIQPSSIAYRDTLSWAFFKNKRYTEALEAIEILYENHSEISPEIDFHYAAILNEMGLLNNPVETFDKMLVKPEIILNISLRNEVFKARQNAYNKSEEKK